MTTRRLIDPPDLPEANDRERSGYGLPALHKRYRRRAEYLSANGDYRQAIRDARETWNTRYPAYAIRPGDTLGTCGAPQRLERDVETNTQRFARSERSGLGWGPEMDAWSDWQTMIAGLAGRFWPEDDFPAPGNPTHPATAFVAACLVTGDTRSLDNDAYFHPPALRVYQRYGDGPCIPIYPGMTADDLRKAADRLAQEAEAVFPVDLPIEKVRRLRDRGETLQAIADRFGLAESTVRAMLKT